MEHINDDGTFKDTFKGSIAEFAGEAHKDTKAFDSIKDISSLIKVHADTKSALGKKMDGHIKIPTEGSTDTEKANFQAQIAKLSGKPDNSADYVFVTPDDLPEGLRHNAETEKQFRELFHRENLSIDTVSRLTELFNNTQIARRDDALGVQQKEFDTQVTGLEKDWTGDSMVENSRIAFKAMILFGDEALIKSLKESKINEDVGNHRKWREQGFAPQVRKIWYNIGVKTKAADAITDEGEPAGKGGKGAETGGLTPAGVYTHPTSAVLLEKK